MHAWMHTRTYTHTHTHMLAHTEHQPSLSNLGHISFAVPHCSRSQLKEGGMYIHNQRGHCSTFPFTYFDTLRWVLLWLLLFSSYSEIHKLTCWHLHCMKMTSNTWLCLLHATPYSTLNGQSWSRVFVVALSQDSSSWENTTQVQAFHSCPYHYTHWHTHCLSTHKTCLVVDAGAGDAKWSQA